MIIISSKIIIKYQNDRFLNIMGMYLFYLSQYFHFIIDIPISTIDVFNRAYSRKIFETYKAQLMLKKYMHALITVINGWYKYESLNCNMSTVRIIENT